MQLNSITDYLWKDGETGVEWDELANGWDLVKALELACQSDLEKDED